MSIIIPRFPSVWHTRTCTLASGSLGSSFVLLFCLTRIGGGGVRGRGVRSRGVGGGGGVSGSRSLIGGIAVDNLHTDLLGEGQLDGLAGGSAQRGLADLQGLRHLLDGGHGDALLGGQVLAGDLGQGNGLVHAGLDGLRVDNLDGGLDGGHHRGVEAGLLGHLLAVVVTVAGGGTVAAVAGAVCGGGSRLAHGHHLVGALLLEGDLHGLGGGSLGLGLVGVGADLVVDLLRALCAYGPGDGVALLFVNDVLAAEDDWLADGGEGGRADLGSLHNVENGAVVLGRLVGRVGGGTVGGSAVGGSAIGWGAVGGTRVGHHCQGHESNQSKDLKEEGKKLFRTSWEMGRNGSETEGNLLGNRRKLVGKQEGLETG
jgi:hypothetical protein